VAQLDDVHSVSRLKYETLKGLISLASTSVAKPTLLDTAFYCETDVCCRCCTYSTDAIKAQICDKLQGEDIGCNLIRRDKRQMLRQIAHVTFAWMLVSASSFPIQPSTANAADDRVWITIVNHGSFAHSYTIRDEVCHNSWNVSPPIQPGKSDRVGLCSNHALSDGYGEMSWHHEDQTIWDHASLLRNGQTISLGS
jgi:hypothetical protein